MLVSVRTVVLGASKRIIKRGVVTVASTEVRAPFPKNKKTKTFRCSYCGSSRIKTCANACDHGLSFKSLSRATGPTPCISSLKNQIFSPMVENKNIGLAGSLSCFIIGKEYFYWLIKNNQPMRIFLARSSCCCYCLLYTSAAADE